jgi:phosphate transport system permease protein
MAADKTHMTLSGKHEVGTALRKRQSRAVSETLIKYLLMACGLISVLTTAGIIGVLLYETIAFFREVPLSEFVTDTRWTPRFATKHFGILPLLVGTLMTSAIALLVALPLGLLGAIYLSEYASRKTRSILKPILEVLAGIPTVVYGYFALLFVTPLLKLIDSGIGGGNAISPGLVMGIMILPLVASLSEDALTAVPRSLRDGAYALGATRYEVSTRVVVPAAISGITASFILAISRAVGETMIVAIAAGNRPVLTFDPRDQIQTMTAYIAQVSMGDIATGTIEYRTIFAVASTLFIITFVLNLISHFIVRHFRKMYTG